MDKKYQLKEKILIELDLAFKGELGRYFPKPSEDILIIGEESKFIYNFFLDLEDGYLITSNSQIHLYSDLKRWAIVFETNGYHTRQSNAHINLIYLGNCIEFNKQGHSNHLYISNSSSIELISETEFKRIENKEGSEMELFELVDESMRTVKVRDEVVNIEQDKKKYEERSMKFRDYDNPKNLIDFENLVRYLSETKPELMNAKEKEIKKFIPKDLTKIMKIDSFFQKTNYEEQNLPSSYETYQLIAKVLSTGNSDEWKPKLKPNNHWTNWESGTL